MGRQTVERALDILSLFSINHPRWGITEISEALNLSKPTVHGLVRTLLDRGFVSQDAETKKYSLGLSIYELGTLLAGTLKINQAAMGPAQRLVEESKMTLRIAIWDQDTVLVTLTLYPNLQTAQYGPPGPRVPAYCSSTGKAVLCSLTQSDLASYLDRTPLIPYTAHTITSKKQLIRDLEKSRLRGYSIDCEEYMLGLACIGAPIFDGTGKVIGALSLSGPPDHILEKEFPRMSKGVLLAARDISHIMGYSEGLISRRSRNGLQQNRSPRKHPAEKMVGG